MVEADGQLNVQKAVLANSTLSVASLLETPSLYAARILQSEKPLKEFVAGQTQFARSVAPTEQRTVQVFQVMSSIRESPLDIKRLAGQTAKASMPESEVVGKSQELVMDYYVLPQKVLPVETSMPSISFTEQRAVSVGHVIEAEIQPGLSTDFKPEEKTAVRLIPEHVQTAVSSVQVAYKEDMLDHFIGAQSQVARPVTNQQRTIVVSQVQPSDVIHCKHDHWAVDGEWEIAEWETIHIVV